MGTRIFLAFKMNNLVDAHRVISNSYPHDARAYCYENVLLRCFLPVHLSLEELIGYLGVSFLGK